MARPSGHVILS